MSHDLDGLDGPDEYPGMGLRNTPDDIDAAIGRLVHEPGTPAERLRRTQQAYALLPEPRTAYYDSLWLLRDIGEHQYRVGDYMAACATLQMLLQEVAEAALVPGVCVHLGMSLHELGEPGAWCWLWLANVLLHRDEFGHVDPKYWAIVDRLEASNVG